MTRVTILDPSDLTNEWLLANHREIPRVVNELIDHPERLVLKDIPKQFTLNVGHVKFFRNKLLYIAKLHQATIEECKKRGINYDKDIVVNLDDLPDHVKMFCLNDWTPTTSDHCIIIERLRERFALRGKAYHMTKDNIKTRIDSDEEFNVYYTNHLKKYL